MKVDFAVHIKITHYEGTKWSMLKCVLILSHHTTRATKASGFYIPSCSRHKQAKHGS